MNEPERFGASQKWEALLVLIHAGFPGHGLEFTLDMPERSMYIESETFAAGLLMQDPIIQLQPKKQAKHSTMESIALNLRVANNGLGQ